MAKMGFNSSYTKLENYYFVKLLSKIKEITSKPMKIYVWQEIFDDGVKVCPFHNILIAFRLDCETV